VSWELGRERLDTHPLSKIPGYATDRNRKLDISTEPKKSKSREPAAFQNKIDRQIGRESDLEIQAGRQSDGYGGWCLELRRGGR